MLTAAERSRAGAGCFSWEVGALLRRWFWAESEGQGEGTKGKSRKVGHARWETGSVKALRRG